MLTPFQGAQTVLDNQDENTYLRDGLGKVQSCGRVQNERIFLFLALGKELWSVAHDGNHDQKHALYQYWDAKGEYVQPDHRLFNLENHANLFKFKVDLTQAYPQQPRHQNILSQRQTKVDKHDQWVQFDQIALSLRIVALIVIVVLIYEEVTDWDAADQEEHRVENQRKEPLCLQKLPVILPFLALGWRRSEQLLPCGDPLATHEDDIDQCLRLGD